MSADPGDDTAATRCSGWNPRLLCRRTLVSRRTLARLRRWLLTFFVAAIHVPVPAAELLGFGEAGSVPAPPWRVSGLPGQTKPFTHFTVVDLDGRRALEVDADHSYGNLVYPLKLDAPSARLTWQWRIDQPVAGADLRQRSGDDTSLKVCVLFDLPIARLGFAEREMMRYAQSRSNEPLPAATVCYVWDPQLPVGTGLDNAFTRRMRYLVVRGAPLELHRWMPESRDVGADFLKLFGDESDTVPPIVGVAVGADSDNTGSHSIADISALTLAR